MADIKAKSKKDKTEDNKDEKDDTLKDAGVAGESDDKAGDGEAEGNDEAQEGGSEAGSPPSKAKVEKVFEKFLARCQEDIDDRRTKRLALLDTYKQNTMIECTFKPKITHRGETAPKTQQIGHSLYYRGLLDMQSRLERQKRRLEEVVQAEKEACPFKPNSLQDVASKYVEFIRTPRMTTPQPTPRKEPLRLDLSEELNQNARDARDLYRQDLRTAKTKRGYVDASIERFHSLTSHLQESIVRNAPPDEEIPEQGAFSSPLGGALSGATSGDDDHSTSPKKGLVEGNEDRKRSGSILKKSPSAEESKVASEQGPQKTTF